MEAILVQATDVGCENNNKKYVPSTFGDETFFREHE